MKLSHAPRVDSKCQWLKNLALAGYPNPAEAGAKWCYSQSRLGSRLRGEKAASPPRNFMVRQVLDTMCW
jgi:hypothetical protein